MKLGIAMSLEVGIKFRYIKKCFLVFYECSATLIAITGPFKIMPDADRFSPKLCLFDGQYAVRHHANFERWHLADMPARAWEVATRYGIFEGIQI